MTGLWTDGGFGSYSAVYINLSYGNYNDPDVNSVEYTFGYLRNSDSEAHKPAV
jgi:hypothetical protein